MHATAAIASQRMPASQLSVCTVASCYNCCTHSRVCGTFRTCYVNFSRWLSGVWQIFRQSKICCCASKSSALRLACMSRVCQRPEDIFIDWVQKTTKKGRPDTCVSSLVLLLIQPGWPATRCSELLWIMGKNILQKFPVAWWQPYW